LWRNWEARVTFNKRELSERDICTKYITPALQSAGWNVNTQIREEYQITNGRIRVRGQRHTRDKAKRADYVLFYKSNIPIAVIEAKDNKHTVGDGMQQAVDYGTMLDVPFVYSSNGDAFLEHDLSADEGSVEQPIALNSFPSPEELWQRAKEIKQIESQEHEKVVTSPGFREPGGKEPRYYQQVAINRAIDAIAKGQDRILLVMATGTGKTYTAFQIIWHLWKSQQRKRILFLADRNILVDQTRINDFKPFGAAMTKIKNRTIDPSYEIHLALYQAITGNEEEKKIYKQFSPDYFDLIVVDECHRGSAADDSAWREILDYFNAATQIGMTATPKETEYVSNIDYFGEPIYTYSLRQGIEDGFLAPYKVIRIDLDRDLQGWRPKHGQRDDHGELIEDRIYNQQDMDRTLVLEKRTELVAKKVTEYLQATDPYAKTIVFCEDIDHAERMRQTLVNENAEHVHKDHRYIMRITGDETIGKAELDNFIDPESTYPVIVTTSKLLSTGVDAQTCKLIVLDQTIHSLSSFKQIIGRGTRINEDYGKFFFAIIDFKKATELFADPEFDGPPEQIYQPKPGDPPNPPDVDPGPEPEPKPDAGRVKYVVGSVEVAVVAERVQYYGNDGRLITEELRDYTRRNVHQEYATLEQFLKVWTSAERKHEITEQLEDQGILLSELAQHVGRDYDAFDLVCHVAFDQPPLTRKERVNNVRKRDVFTKYGAQARAVLEALLEKYADSGIDQVEDINVLNVQPFSELGTPLEIVDLFGGKDEYIAAVRELEVALYER
jgi:type I restriction enzyme, R subunit